MQGELFTTAQEYFNRIPDGHAHAMARPWNKVVDRSLRRLIEKANNNGDCIINVGEGIYRPVPGDPVDEKELKQYLAKELHRARAIQLKRLCMITAFGRKVIQDALVETHVLKNDGWKEIVGFRDDFYIDKENPRVEVEIEEVGN